MIASQDYGWSQLAARAGSAWPDAADRAMQTARLAGFRAWEPLVRSVEDANRIGGLARANGLAMASIFVTGNLHVGETAEATIATLLGIARAAGEFGCVRVLIYPSPPGKGEQADKSDAQLVTQANRLEAFARLLAPLGISLCYHPEEGEMRQGAREFHHMLLGTDPGLLRLCLDPDTVWRGTGFSQVAVLDIIRLHGHRVDSVHLRQSQDGVWSETLGAGDLDYPMLIGALAATGAAPHLVVEHAYEPATRMTLTPEEAHRQSHDYVVTTLLPRLCA